MTAPLLTTNDSEITRLEGLYIKERLPPAAIAGVSLNDVVVCAEAIRGPVGKAVLCGSASRVREVFGGRDQGSGGITTSPLWRSLINKPFSRVWVARAAAAAAVKGTLTLSNVTPTAILRVDASSVGAWGANVAVEVADASDGDATHFNLKITYLGGLVTLKNLNCQSGFDNLLATLGDDDGNWVTLTKLANGRPLNSGPANLASAADGSIADSDFTGTGKAMEIANNIQNVAALWVAERSSAALKTKIATLAALRSSGDWIMCPDAASTSAATAESDAATLRSDRTIYTFNHAYTLDPEVGAEMLVDPCSWMAAVLSQTDVDIHPGEEDTKVVTAGIIRLYNETYDRGTYIALKDAGICALEKDDGFSFVSGVTTSLTPGKEQITRRRMTDYLQISLAKALKHFAKKKNTKRIRLVRNGIIHDFLDDLAKAGRVVDADDDGKGLFSVDSEVLNTPTTRSQGIEKDFVRVKLVDHALYLVLETEIGTSVKVNAA